MELELEQSRNGKSSVAEQPDERGWVTELRAELDGYLLLMQGFATADPGKVMESISSMHARLIQIRVMLQRSGSQRVSGFRTREVDPVIEALEFQFKVHSRIISTTEMEWKMAGGAS